MIRRFLLWVLSIVWLIALSGYVIVGAGLVPFHGDESTQIYMGRDFFYVAQVTNYDRLLDTPPINSNPAEQDLRLLNGTLPKYVYGAIAYGMGYTLNTLNEQWDWSADFAYNERTNRIPDDRLLNTARIASSVMLAVAVWGVFWLGKELGGSMWAGVLASALFVLHPDALINGRRAMMEGFMLGFGTLAIMTSVLALRLGYFTFWYRLGLFSGLAVASKHTALFTVAAAFASVPVVAIIQRSPSRQWVGRIIGLIFAAVVAGGIFFGLNPAWWSNPIDTAQDVLQRRTALLEGQTATYGGYENTQEQLMGFLRQSITPTPQYYEVEGWEAYFANDIRTYEASLWAGGGNVWRGLWATGLAFSIVMMITGLRAFRPVYGVLLVWLVAMVVLTLGLTPLEWHRYYLPIVPLYAVLAGGGLMWAINALRHRIQETQTPNDPQTFQL